MPGTLDRQFLHDVSTQVIDCMLLYVVVGGVVFVLFVCFFVALSFDFRLFLHFPEVERGITCFPSEVKLLTEKHASFKE